MHAVFLCGVCKPCVCNVLFVCVCLCVVCVVCVHVCVWGGGVHAVCMCVWCVQAVFVFGVLCVCLFVCV